MGVAPTLAMGPLADVSISNLACNISNSIVYANFGAFSFIKMCTIDQLIRSTIHKLFGTQIIRPLARFYSYDYDLRKTNYIFKWLYFKEIER